MGSHVDALEALSSQAESYLRSPVSATEIREAPGVRPEDVFAAASKFPMPVYLWGDGVHPRGRYSIITHSPYATIGSTPEGALLSRGRDRLAVPLDGVALAASLADTKEGHSEIPFQGGALGYISYEHGLRYLGCHAHRAGAPLPEYFFGLYDHAFVYDEVDRLGYWIGTPDTAKGHVEPYVPVLTSGWNASVDRSEYLRNVESVLENIAAGEIYQANYTVRYTRTGFADPASLAMHMRNRIATPMGGFLSFPFGSIWSASPERIVSGSRNGRLHGHMESCPIKGTRRRDSDPEIDVALSAELLADSKDKAELLMIVDLVRNDLGKVAPYGSVKVESLYELQTFANVHHLEATVSAAMPAQLSWVEVMNSILPGGSITGAPKKRAVEILQAMETVPRSVYTGAMGYFSRHGAADFNLPIRTLYHDGSEFYLHSGSGIVADSVPEREYDELQVKIQNIRTLLERP